VLLLQNHAEALRYFRKAADKNNALGLYGLGYMYLSGTAVTQDYDMAFKKLQAAADAGDRDAHFYLGSMYYNVSRVNRRVGQVYLDRGAAAHAESLTAVAAGQPLRVWSALVGLGVLCYWRIKQHRHTSAKLCRCQ
jgi:tetratricopeptide (TPR) repeat protein